MPSDEGFDEPSEVRRLRELGAGPVEVRLRRVEIKQVRHEERLSGLRSLVGWGFSVLAGMLVAGFAAVLAKVWR